MELELCIMCSIKKTDLNLCRGCSCFVCDNCYDTAGNSIILCQMCHYDYEKAIIRD